MLLLSGVIVVHTMYVVVVRCYSCTHCVLLLSDVIVVHIVCVVVVRCYSCTHYVCCCCQVSQSYLGAGRSPRTRKIFHQIHQNYEGQ